MRLSSQLNLGFLLLAVLPPAGMTLYSYASTQRAYRGAVEAEGRRLTQEMSSRLEQAVKELSSRIEAIRMRAAPRESSAFQQARETALAAAQVAELRSLLKDVLSTTRREPSQIPFALDPDKVLYAAEAADLATLYGLGLAPVPAGAQVVRTDPSDWVVASQEDVQSRVTVGVARPLGVALKEIRLTALRNLAYGLALVALALIGILPLSHRMTRHLEVLTRGVERLGLGDINVQVPVPRGADELERLALTFNRMARELKQQQERLLSDERLHRELEISRRIQEELLPRRAARFACAEAGGLSIPAREVGGDFFNYFAISSNDTAILVGDVSGKGVPAAILMANLQATLSARLPLERDLAQLAERLDRQLASPEAAALYLTLFIAVLDGRGRSLRYVSAGHNTQILVRQGGAIEHLESTGRPLGLLPGGGFEERFLRIDRGDALFLFTDGILDAENALGEPFGMERLEALVSSRANGSVAGILARVDDALRAHRGATEAGDDATIVALRVSSEILEPDGM
jgi:serine phosphatase RsbU (regulator of sigma subunit)